MGNLITLRSKQKGEKMENRVKINLRKVANGIEERLNNRQFDLFNEDDIHRSIEYKDNGTVRAKYVCFDRYTILLIGNDCLLLNKETNKILFLQHEIMRFKDKAKNTSLKSKDTDVIVDILGKEYSVDIDIMQLLIRLGTEEINGITIRNENESLVSDLIESLFKENKEIKSINVDMPYIAATLSAPFSCKVGSDNECVINDMDVKQSAGFDYLDYCVIYDLPDSWWFEIKMYEKGGRQYRLSKGPLNFLDESLNGTNTVLFYKQYSHDAKHVEVSWQERPDKLYKMPRQLFELLKK